MNLADWRELLGLQPRIHDFARRLLDAARSRGVTGWTYDGQSNTLRHEDGGTANLANMFVEYASSRRSGRAALIEKYSSIMSDLARETPQLWQMAAKAIYPVVRSSYDSLLLDLQARASGAPMRRAVTWPLARELSIKLVYDHGASLAHVYEETLQVWGQSHQAVKQQAFDNLRALQRPSWQEIAPGVHQLISAVSYEESLFLVDAVIEGLPFAASAVVLPVNRGVLLAADGNSREGVLALLAAASRSLAEKPWPMSATLLHRSDGQWVEFTATDRVAECARALHQINLETIYRDQGELLQQELGEDVFVGTFALLQKGEGLEHVRSWCTWTEGVRTLMPQTDVVILGHQGNGGASGESLIVEWPHVWTLCGHRLAVTDNDPPRFMVESFPDEAEWQALRPLGEVLRS